MITRLEAVHLMGNVIYTRPILALAQEIKLDRERIDWQPEVAEMIDKVAKRYKNPSRAVYTLSRALRIYNYEFRRAQESYLLEQTAMGGRLFGL